MIQKTEIIGRIGKDAEVNDTNNGNTVINFNVAVSETWKDKQGQKQERTTWYRCSWWINNSVIAQYLTKGTLVYVSGKSNANAYTNQAGEIVVQEGINVRELKLLGGGNSSNQNNSDNGSSQQQSKPEQKQGFEPESDDLPF
tara:strand:- start:503 stop:928 length:426 start_codon:yes stop_codon:yes gene_type:complete